MSGVGQTCLYISVLTRNLTCCWTLLSSYVSEWWSYLFNNDSYISKKFFATFEWHTLCFMIKTFCKANTVTSCVLISKEWVFLGACQAYNYD